MGGRCTAHKVNKVPRSGWVHEGIAGERRSSNVLSVAQHLIAGVLSCLKYLSQENEIHASGKL